MNSTKLASTGLAAAFAAVLPAIAAQAASTRTFVSSAGSDSNPCSITQPCASFAHAYSLTAPNGIVAALDPGKYGPLTITGPVTINGNGWAAITAPAAGNGITINAVSGNVTLKGLEIDGAGAAYNGIVFNSGSNLTISNCDIENFFYTSQAVNPGNGIIIEPSSGTMTFSITDTTLANNGANGFLYVTGGAPTVTGAIDHVKATANTGNGVQIYAVNQTNPGSNRIAISNSLLNNNKNGIDMNLAPNAPSFITMDNLTVAGNTTTGISADAGNAILSLSRSTVMGSATGVYNNIGSQFITYQNNNIGVNYPTNVNGPMDPYQGQ